MSDLSSTASEGRGSRPSPRWSLALGVALLAALAGLAVGRFLTYTDTAGTPLPAVALPDDAGVRELQAAAAATPEDPAVWRELGVAATEQAIATADPAWYAVAADALDRARELDPADPTTAIAEGQLALSLHDFTRARELGLEAAAALPRTAAAWGVLVDAHVELGEYDAAADAAQTMVDLRPDLPALARVSYLRQLRGDLDGAITAMRQADVAGGGAAGASGVGALLGELLLHRGDLDAAESAFADSATPAGAAGIARIAAARGELDRAERILTDLVDRAPVPAAVLALAEVQQRAGDDAGLADTVALARTLATLQQDAGQTVDLELALFEASFGDPARALELAEAAHADRPDNVFAAGALAWAAHRAGDADRAASLAADATRLGTVDTALELRMAEITGEGRDALLDRNPHAEDLFLP